MLLPGLTDPQEGVPARHCGNWDDHVSRLFPANLIHAILQLNLPWQIHSLVQMVCAPIACTRKGMRSTLKNCPACQTQKALLCDSLEWIVQKGGKMLPYSDSECWGCAFSHEVALIEMNSGTFLLGPTSRYKNQLIDDLLSPLPRKSCPACENTTDTPSDISSIRQHCRQSFGKTLATSEHHQRMCTTCSALM